MKSLIAGVTALSLATTPVQANEFNEEDFGKFLFGVVAAIALGAALTKDRDSGGEAVAVQPAPEPPVIRHRPNNTAPRINPRPRHEPPVVRHQPRGLTPHQKVLPGYCFKQVQTRYGTTNLFGQRCLERTYRHVARLPQACAVRVISANNRARRGFDPQCLRNHGFRSNRGRP